MSSFPVLPEQIATIAELRQLYRAAEARAARMRMLSTSGRELAEAGADTIDDVLQACATRIAHFVGQVRAHIAIGSAASVGIAIPAPGQSARIVGRLHIEGFATLEAMTDYEDRDAVRLHLELLGAAIDRVGRERERERLLDALRDREQRLEQLVGRMLTVQEEERRRVSHELHDGVAQTATALARMLDCEVGAHDANNANDDERARLATVARGLVQELRAVIGGLRPTLLDDLGLEAGLRSLVEGLRADGYDATCAITGAPRRLNDAVETALFRVAQEATTNVRKHAGGKCRVAIALHHEAEGRGCMLRVQDNGRGCILPAETFQRSGGVHIGVAVMRERIAAIGGMLDWVAQPGRGVAVTVRLGPA